MPIAKIGRVDDWFTPNAATLSQILETEREIERDREIDREGENWHDPNDDTLDTRIP